MIWREYLKTIYRKTVEMYLKQRLPLCWDWIAEAVKGIEKKCCASGFEKACCTSNRNLWFSRRTKMRNKEQGAQRIHVLSWPGVWRFFLRYAKASLEYQELNVLGPAYSERNLSCWYPIFNFSSTTQQRDPKRQQVLHKCSNYCWRTFLKFYRRLVENAPRWPPFLLIRIQRYEETLDAMEDTRKYALSSFTRKNNLDSAVRLMRQSSQAIRQNENEVYTWIIDEHTQAGYM